MLTQNVKTMKAKVGEGEPAQWVPLNTKQRCDEASRFEEALYKRIVAQDEAVSSLSQLYQLYLANLNLPGKPIGTMLFLGPTGSGKTRVVEAAAEVLFGDPFAIVKIDCAEFQHSHEISKLTGSPPGYIGHRETLPMLTQENLDKHHTPKTKLTFVLFDEIEKASDAVWKLLLGILDKATLTLGDNRRVDFSNCIVIMTSNLGAREMSEITEGRLGFSIKEMMCQQLDAKIEKAGIEAARRKFSPEFMNRLDKVVVFRSLTQEALYQILDLELESIQRRILASGQGGILLKCTSEAKDYLLARGFDRRYGARHLKRVLEQHIIIPLSNLIATKQLTTGDLLCIDVDEESQEMYFTKAPEAALLTGRESSFFTERTAA